MDQKPGISFESDATVFGFSGDVWSLRGVSGELFGKTFPIDRTFTIGRASDCDLVLASQQVSRQHANISLLGNVLVIDDLQSANGTFVNNQRVTEQRELHDGDQIAFSRGERFLLTLKRRNDEIEEDDNSYAQAVRNVAPLHEEQDDRGDSGESDLLTWVLIGATVVVAIGFALWAFL
ncbi:MAG: FHA domain-containing protein [Gammaproteobacteria bacterium]|nr:FHA domain-containing protein [Gammaproteobacteria bacterium]